VQTFLKYKHYINVSFFSITAQHQSMHIIQHKPIRSVSAWPWPDSLGPVGLCRRAVACHTQWCFRPCGPLSRASALRASAFQPPALGGVLYAKRSDGRMVGHPDFNRQIQYTKCYAICLTDLKTKQLLSRNFQQINLYNTKIVSDSWKETVHSVSQQITVDVN